MNRYGHAADVGLGRRIAALLVDGALLGAAFGMLNLLLLKSGVLHAVRLDAETALLAVWARLGVAGPAVAATLLGVVAAWRIQGATPGALLLGFRVLSSRDGDRPAWHQCAARLGAALALGGLGLLWSLGGRAALHDRLSATRALPEDDALSWPLRSGDSE